MAPSANSTSTTRVGDKSSEPQVHIVGPLQFQNELMAWYIRENTGLICACRKNLDAETLSDPPAKKTTLILMDCLANDLTSLWSEIRSFFDSGQKGYYFALFNIFHLKSLDLDILIVKMLINRVFYEIIGLKIWKGTYYE